jgi:hypothetical protein
MIKFVPVPIKDHDLILGKDFNSKFAKEMKEYYKPFVKKNRDIQVAKETWEYAVSDSISNAEWCGAGKNVVDVKTPSVDLDVKGLSIGVITDSQTTEASFLQNNKQENDGFGKLFENKDFLALKQMFVDPMDAKVKGTNNLHLLSIIREKSTRKVYYCLLKVEYSTISDSDFLSQMTIDGKRSVSLPMIDSTYGKTYIYIAKRRLEIRLNGQGLKSFLVYSHGY